MFDDIQWGEETFLDLVESTALLSTGAPLLLLCMARPELVERRPAGRRRCVWSRCPGAGRRADRRRVTAGCASGSREAAGGNPLFISEMLAMAGEQRGGRGAADAEGAAGRAAGPAREPERRVLERGSVEGEIFYRGGVQALAPEETQVTTRLAALVRQQLVRPDRSQLAGDDGYRFRHLLIRDAAYDALPKAVRADLHARFAAWLEERGGSWSSSTSSSATTSNRPTATTPSSAGLIRRSPTRRPSTSLRPAGGPDGASTTGLHARCWSGRCSWTSARPSTWSSISRR